MAGNRLHPIPKPDGLPVVGNVLTVNADTPLQSLLEISKEQGPIFWLDMMGKASILVAGAELTHELCDETRFDKTVRGPLNPANNPVGRTRNERRNSLIARVLSGQYGASAVNAPKCAS